MRVLCVNHEDFEGDCFPWSESDPQIGSEYEVVRATLGYDKKGKPFHSYKIKGFDEWLYDQRNFARIAHLDETELVTEEFEEKYCVPVNSIS